MRSYESEAAFRNEVVSTLLDLDPKIASSGSVDAFWNVTRDRQKIVARRPKFETELQPIIQQIISDRALIRGIEIVREAQAAGGALDFCFMAPISGGGIAKVPVECKLAHSQDILHGRTHQLPAYARALGCSFGVYLVLWFKGEDFDEPADNSVQDLLLRVGMQADAPFDVYVRDVSVDMSRRPPPSML